MNAVTMLNFHLSILSISLSLTHSLCYKVYWLQEAKTHDRI
jgi:hypothetical protein